MKKILSYLALSVILAILAVSYFPLNAACFSYIAGDVSCDEKVTAYDARAILRLSIGIEKAEENSIYLRADIDSDGKITAEDARKALRLAVGIRECEAEKKPFKGEIAGCSENGYLIFEADGITYIDGIPIVNKTYSLPSSFAPDGLLSECKAAFNKLQTAAAEKGLSVYISSGYRSFAKQESIYNRYVSRDGKELADTYSARPGHSEHQTGLAIDLNTISKSFADTPEGKWVAAHCHEYGFIIRYPKGKSDITGYMYEPWHIRYVGKEIAEKIYDSGLCLEEYYGITSEYCY